MSRPRSAVSSEQGAINAHDGGQAELVVVKKDLTIAWILQSLAGASLQCLKQPHDFVASFALRAACSVFTELARAELGGAPGEADAQDVLHYYTALELEQLADETAAALQELPLPQCQEIIQRLVFMCLAKLSDRSDVNQLDDGNTLVRPVRRLQRVA